MDFRIAVARWKMAEQPQCQSNRDSLRNGLPAGECLSSCASWLASGKNRHPPAVTGLKRLRRVHLARSAAGGEAPSLKALAA